MNNGAAFWLFSLCSAAAGRASLPNHQPSAHFSIINIITKLLVKCVSIGPVGALWQAGKYHQPASVARSDGGKNKKRGNKNNNGNEGNDANRIQWAWTKGERNQICYRAVEKKGTQFGNCRLALTVTSIFAVVYSLHTRKGVCVCAVYSGILLCRRCLLFLPFH